jgi:hypothetical protein
MLNFVENCEKRILALREGEKQFWAIFSKINHLRVFVAS